MKQSIVEIPIRPKTLDVEAGLQLVINAKLRAILFESEPGDPTGTIASLILGVVKLGEQRGLNIQFMQDGGGGGGGGVKQGKEQVNWRCKRVAMWLSQERYVNGAVSGGMKSEVRR